MRRNLREALGNAFLSRLARPGAIRATLLRCCTSPSGVSVAAIGAHPAEHRGEPKRQVQPIEMFHAIQHRDITAPALTAGATAGDGGFQVVGLAGQQHRVVASVISQIIVA